jgi:hypothetical protein
VTYVDLRRCARSDANRLLTLVRVNEEHNIPSPPVRASALDFAGH